MAGGVQRANEMSPHALVHAAACEPLISGPRLAVETHQNTASTLTTQDRTALSPVTPAPGPAYPSARSRT